MVERILYNIKSLLQDAGQLDERYAQGAETLTSDLSTPRGIDIFKISFERFKSRIRKQQKDASTWHVTRWAIHDSKKFEDIINRLQKFVDGLEKITASLGHLAEQRARLQEEIENISDVQSLKLLRDASTNHSASHHGSSNSASRLLAKDIAESVLEQHTLASRSILRAQNHRL